MDDASDILRNNQSIKDQEVGGEGWCTGDRFMGSEARASVETASPRLA